MSENITSNNTRRAEQLKAFERLLDVLDELRVKCPWEVGEHSAQFGSL